VGTELPGWMVSSSRSSESLANLVEPAAAAVRSVNQDLAVAVHRYREWTEMDSRVEEMIRLICLLDCGDVTELHSLAAGQPSLHPRAKLRLLGLRNKIIGNTKELELSWAVIVQFANSPVKPKGDTYDEQTVMSILEDYTARQKGRNSTVSYYRAMVQEAAEVFHQQDGAGMQVPDLDNALDRCKALCGPERPTDWVTKLAPCEALVAAGCARLLKAVATLCPLLHRHGHCTWLGENCSYADSGVSSDMNNTRLGRLQSPHSSQSGCEQTSEARLQACHPQATSTPKTKKKFCH